LKVTITIETLFCKGGLTAGVTGKRGMWREKPPDAESAVGSATSKVWANARTCPVHAVLGVFGQCKALCLKEIKLSMRQILQKLNRLQWRKMELAQASIDKKSI